MALYGAVPPFEDPEIPIDYCCRGLGQPEVRSDLQSLPHVFGAAHHAHHLCGDLVAAGFVVRPSDSSQDIDKQREYSSKETEEYDKY